MRNMGSNAKKLKEWIEKELMVSDNREELVSVLNSVKERVKNHLRLSKEGSITLRPQARKLQKCLQIYLYLIGKAYGYIADIFDDYDVTNEELEKKLKLPNGTVKYCLKELRDKGWIIPLKPGVHKVDPSRIEEVLDVIDQEVIGDE